MSFPRVNPATGRMEIPNEYDPNAAPIVLGPGGGGVLYQPPAPEPENISAPDVSFSGGQEPQASAPSGKVNLSRGGRIKQLFGDVIYSLAQGMGAASQETDKSSAESAAFAGAFNAPSARQDQELKRRLTRAQAGEIEQRTKLAGEYVTLPNGMTVHSSLAQKLFPSLIGAQSREKIAGAQIDSREKIAGLKEGEAIPVPAKLANQIGLPEIAGKKLGKSGWENINKRLSAGGKNLKVTDIGDKRYLLNTETGEKEELGAAPGYTAGIARADAWNRSRARYNVVTFQDPESGQMRSGSALEALNSGVPTVARPNGERILSRTAVMNDIRASLGQLRGATKAMDDASGTERLMVARVLRDPHSTVGSFMNSTIINDINPELQDYVIQNLNSREQIFGLRKALTGGSAGSDAQAAEMLRTLPSSENGEVARKKIDTALGVLGRLEQGIQKLGPSAGKVQKWTRDAQGNPVRAK